MDTNDVFHDSAVLSPSILQCDMFYDFRLFFVILMLSRHPDHRYLDIYLHPLLSLAGRSYGTASSLVPPPTSVVTTSCRRHMTITTSTIYRIGISHLGIPPAYNAVVSRSPFTRGVLG